MYFIVYIEDITSHAETQNFSLSVEKCFTSERSERVKYFFQHERTWKFCISKPTCNLLFMI